MVRVAAQEKLFEAKKLPLEKLSYSHEAELHKLSDDNLKLIFTVTLRKLDVPRILVSTDGGIIKRH